MSRPKLHDENKEREFKEISKKNEKKEKQSEEKIFKAKKDFEIFHNSTHIFLKEGKEYNLKDIPKIFWQNLKTENVI